MPKNSLETFSLIGKILVGHVSTLSDVTTLWQRVLKNQLHSLLANNNPLIRCCYNFKCFIQAMYRIYNEWKYKCVLKASYSVLSIIQCPKSIIEQSCYIVKQASQSTLSFYQLKKYNSVCMSDTDPRSELQGVIQVRGGYKKKKKN